MPSVRETALAATGDVLRRGGKPREVLDRLTSSMNRRDRAFVMEAVYGVVRQRDTLDWALARYLAKPSGIPARTRDNLRLGAYQILNMRVPDWAAVDEAVSLERKNRGLVNAVLRKVAGQKSDIRKDMGAIRKTVLKPSTPLSEKAAGLSVLTSHPRWLARRWITRLGDAEAMALAEANNHVPPLTLRVNTLVNGRDEVIEELRAQGLSCIPTKSSPDGIILEEKISMNDAAWLIGKVYVQDEAAQLVSRILDPRPGERVLDACAAPGGKTTHIAQIMGDRGHVVAVDIDGERLERLKENIRTQQVTSVQVLQGDATEAAEAHGPFDRVLLDAPCTSLGVIRRNPDVKYRHKRADLAGFHERQLSLLRGVSHALVPGGVLVFATCSTEPEEGEDVIAEFLKSSGDIFNIEVIPDWGESMRTYPHQHGMDGFFVARLRRKK